MLNPLTLFAAEASPSIHIAPGHTFTIAGVELTNSIIYGWLVSLVLIAGLIYLAKRVTVRPKGGVIQFVEAIAGFVSDVVTNAFNNKDAGRKYVPFFVTLFFFVLLHSWAGLLPGVGDAIQIDGHPLFRPMTGDLNLTLAMGLITMAYVYTASVRAVGGFGKYIRHFFIGSPLNPLYLIIGCIEMFTDLTRAFSLALRLFLNITIGEIVIAVFVYLGGLIAPGSVLSPVAALPFTLMEIGVAALQAYIFVVLGVNYLATTVNSAHAHAEHGDGGEQPAEAIGSAQTAAAR